MIDSQLSEETPTVETVKAASPKEHLDAQADVVSDPARADQVGVDWTDEGGATPEGPATTGELR